MVDCRSVFNFWTREMLFDQLQQPNYGVDDFQLYGSIIAANMWETFGNCQLLSKCLPVLLRRFQPSVTWHPMSRTRASRWPENHLVLQFCYGQLAKEQSKLELTCSIPRVSRRPWKARPPRQTPWRFMNFSIVLGPSNPKLVGTFLDSMVPETQGASISQSTQFCSTFSTFLTYCPCSLWFSGLRRRSITRATALQSEGDSSHTLPFYYFSSWTST